MLYIKMICENFNVDQYTAEIVMNKMSISGFRFSSSSEETILEEAGFILKHCM